MYHDIITKEENESEEPNVIYEEKSGISTVVPAEVGIRKVVRQITIGKAPL